MMWAARAAVALNAALIIAVVIAGNEGTYRGFDLRNARDWLAPAVFLVGLNAIGWLAVSLAVADKSSRSGRLFRLWLDAKESELKGRAKTNH